MSSIIDLCNDSDQDPCVAFQSNGATTTNNNNQDDSSSSSSSSSEDDDIWNAGLSFSQGSNASRTASSAASRNDSHGRKRSNDLKTTSQSEQPLTIKEGANEEEEDDNEFDSSSFQAPIKHRSSNLKSSSPLKFNSNSSKRESSCSLHESVAEASKRKKQKGAFNEEKVDCIEIDLCSDDDDDSDNDDDDNGKDEKINVKADLTNNPLSSQQQQPPNSIPTSIHNPYKNDNIRKRNELKAKAIHKKLLKDNKKIKASHASSAASSNSSSITRQITTSNPVHQQQRSTNKGKSTHLHSDDSDDSCCSNDDSDNFTNVNARILNSKSTKTTKILKSTAAASTRIKSSIENSGLGIDTSKKTTCCYNSDTSHSSQSTISLPLNKNHCKNNNNNNNTNGKINAFTKTIAKSPPEEVDLSLDLSTSDDDDSIVNDNVDVNDNGNEVITESPSPNNSNRCSNINEQQSSTVECAIGNIDSGASSDGHDNIDVNGDTNNHDMSKTTGTTTIASTTAAAVTKDKSNKVRNPYDRTKSTAPSPKIPRKLHISQELDQTLILPISQLKSELEDIHGISTKMFLEKRELAVALAEARVDAIIASSSNTDGLDACGVTNNLNDSMNVSFEMNRSFVNYGDYGCESDEEEEKEDDSKSLSSLQITSKTPTKKTKSLPIKNNEPKKDDSKVFDIDSDDSSSSASVPLFTPRPTKKMAKGQQTSTSASNSKVNSSGKPCPGSSSSTTSKLLTPCAFSPPLNSPMGTFAAKRKVPTPAIPAMPTDLINEIGGKLYPDLRHNFLLALTSHARKFRHNSYQRASFDSALRSVVVISLHLRPLRSPEAARRLKGVGSNFYDLMKESVAGPKGKKPYAPKKEKFSSVASAALVALLQLEESSESVASVNSQSFSMENLIESINLLIDPRSNASLNQTAEQYLNPDNLDPGWGQVKKLCSTNANADIPGPFIKERKKKHACASGVVYELLDAGREIAKNLRDLARAGPSEPGPLRQLPNETVDEEFGSVTMSMDLREGGGGTKSLHKMCDQLDIRGVPYVVRELKIADYVFFVGDKLAPILIERKTTDDVASSLHDGRWERQQRNMRKAQYILGDGPERRCQICYIIEGDANKNKVHGGNVGRRTYFQSVEDVENAIEELPLLGFSVIRSKAHLDTIGILAKIAQDVSWKAKNGNIDARFTYKKFLERIKMCDEKLGNPPTSKEHRNPAPPVVVNWNPPAPKSSKTNVGKDHPRSDKAAPSKDAKPMEKATVQHLEEDSEQVEELKKLSIQALKDRCKERGEKLGGKKDELIARLLKPRKPEILIMRARRNEYVPKVPSCNAALMVALLLHHIPGTQGVAKERLLVLAEETGVSKESMSGDGGFYDGWSGIKELQRGDPALVRREKGHRYCLTTQPPESSGVAVANALHIVAHREGLCNCGSAVE